MNLYRLNFTIVKTQSTKRDVIYFEASDDAAAVEEAVLLLAAQQTASAAITNSKLFSIGTEIALS